MANLSRITGALRKAAALGGATRQKPLNLALQGGGAHGAFTWGVLDRLLEDGRFRFDGVSGTSAGAVNAVGFAAGLSEGGPEGARAKLETLWRAVSEKGQLSPLKSSLSALSQEGGGRNWSTSHVMFDLMTRVLSPYQLNPLDVNPLRDVLEEAIDFKRLRRTSPVSLHIAATDVANGAARIFTEKEISVDVVLASACLPQIHQAVKIGRRHYWDGGYSANPALLPLVRDCRAEDTLLVQIDPSTEKDLPTRSSEIFDRLNRVTFNAPLQREIEMIHMCREMAGEGFTFGSRRRGRFQRHRFHRIEAARYTRDLAPGSKMSPDWELLCYLRDSGRTAARNWVKKCFPEVGARSTVDLAEAFA